MGTEKIKATMSTMEMVVVMSEGNMGAMSVISRMIGNTRSFMDILLCDSLEIRGSKLYMLYNDCCDRDFKKFERTLMMLRYGVFSFEEIHQNLNLIRAIPFIDETLTLDGLPSYDEEFDSEHELWDEYCALQKNAFLKRLNNIKNNRR